MEGLEDRKQSLKRTGRCFLCLGRGHLSRQCRSKARCSECNGGHHRSICSGSAGWTQNPQPAGANASSTSSSSPNLNPEARPYQPPSTSLLVGAKGAVLLQTTNVRVYDPEVPEHSMNVRAILDTGSQQSYVSQRVRDVLVLKPHRKQTMSVMTFSSSEQKTQSCDVVRVSLATRDGRGQELELFTVPLICQPLTAQPIDLCATKYKHLVDLDLADASNNEEVSLEIDLLIGSDCYWTLVTGEIRRGEAGPVAIHTRLGWVLSGVAPALRETDTSHSFLTTHVLRVDASQYTENLDEVLQSFWKLESLGIEDSADPVLDEFTQTVRFSEGRYEVALPWKDSHPPLPDNFDLSSQRLHSLLRRLKQDPVIMNEYNTVTTSTRDCGGGRSAQVQ